MEKHNRHHDLSEIKRAFDNSNNLGVTNIVTLSARNGARELKLSDEDVVAVIQNLTFKDFYKSMTSEKDHTIWQDVYKPTYLDKELYVKFTRDENDPFYVLISFKKK